MHPEAYEFVREAVAALPRHPRRVCELGSLNVNGSIRGLFPEAALYVGVDLAAGPGVDVVADAADWSPPDWLRFDCVVSTEALEHTPRAADICANALRLLEPGGVLIVTAAGVGREPHTCGGAPLGDSGEFYRNVVAADLVTWLSGFAGMTVRRRGHDIYAVATR